MRHSLAALSLSLFLAGSFDASADTSANGWRTLVREADTWTKAPALAEKSEIFCHFYGFGKFKVYVKSGGQMSCYTIDSPADYMPVSFVRLLNAGEAEVRVETVSDPRYTKPLFVGLIATSDSRYMPDPLDLKYPLFLRARNRSDEKTTVGVTGVCQSEFTGAFHLGYISGNGFAPTGVMEPNEASRLIRLSHHLASRTVLTFRLYHGTTNSAVDLEFFSDPAGANLLHTLSFRGHATTNQSLIVYPQPDNTLKWSTPAEIMRKGHALLDEAARKDAAFRRPVPKKAYVSTSVADVGEDLATFTNELALVRRVGANSAYNDLGRVNDRRAELGFDYGWDMARNFIPIPAGWLFDPKAAADYARRAHGSGTVPRKTPIMLTDEPIFRGIVQSAELDVRLRAWMQRKGMTPADAGCAGWDEVQAIAPSAANKRLSVVSRAFQVAQYIDCFNGFAAAYAAISTNFLPAVNWGMLEYMDGLQMDLWEMYRQPGFGIVWAEDWYGYEPLGAGAIAWYADLMRSQQKYRSLPAGTYPILGWGYAPATTTMKYYERMMRGCYTFETYAYSPRGNQCSWVEQSETLLLLARLHRDLAAVEDILVGGKVVQAQVAILYPYSSMIWDPCAGRDAQALYTACLQAGIPVDILTEQDLVDGYAKDYKLLCGVGANIRQDALGVVDSFIKSGGTVAWSAPDVRDPYDELIPGAAEIFGAGSLVCVTNALYGRWVYELPGVKALDTVTWDDRQVAVYCQKSTIELLPGSQVVGVFSDGSPAVIKTSRGKGTVYLYAFAPGLSYMKADYGGNTRTLATVLCSNNKERALAVLPAEDIEGGIRLSESMVSARAVVNDDAGFVGLVDYGLGYAGRRTKNPDQYSVNMNMETMEPFPVGLTIACATEPREVYGVRAGAVVWEYRNGALHVQVPLQGVEMIVFKWRDGV